MALEDHARTDEAPGFLSGGGEMGALIRAHDWSGSPLGPPEGWPRPLRTAVRLLLSCGHPMYIWWGPKLLCFYNDAYRDLIGGERHPGSLGLSAQAVWAEIWDIIGPQIEQVMAGRGATWHENQLVPITRNGRREDVYWTYSYSPIDDEAAPNGVGGVLVICAETTQTVLAEQRLRESEARFREQFENANDFIFTADLQMRITSCNPAVAGAIGRAPEDLIGQSIAEFVRPEMWERTKAMLGAKLAGQEATRYEVEVKAADGREMTWEINSRLTRDGNGAPNGLHAIGRDVTERRRAENALRESEARLRALTDHLPGGMVYQVATGADGVGRRFLYVSQSHQQLTGIPAEAVTADPTIAYQLIEPEDRPLVAAAEAEAIRTRNVFDVQVRFRRADGEQRWCRIISAPREQADGSLIWDGIQIDITGQKLAEEALRLKGEEFYTLADNIPTLCWMAYPDGHIFWYNRRWYEYTGTSPDSQEGWGWESVHDPKMLPAVAERWRQSLASGTPFEMTFPLRGSDGIFRPFLTRVVPIRDGSGAILRWFGTNTDVTDLHAAEEALLAARTRAEAEAAERSAILGQLAEGVIVTDAGGRITFVNEAAKRLHGVAELDVEPADYSQTYHLFREDGSPYPSEELPLARAVLHGETTIDARWRIRRPDGTDVLAIGSAQPLRGPDGTRVGAVLTVRDDTARRAAEQALRALNETLEQRVEERTDELVQAQEQLRQSQKLEAMGQLTGGVAHDFNNLLTPIIGGLDLLKRRRLGGERQQRLIDGGLQSAERAKTLVQRLLAFARRQPLQPGAVDVASLVEGMADLIASTSGPQIRLIVDLPGDLPAAKADPNQLEMAILNLSVNARDAMPNGGTLTISVAPETVQAGHRSRLKPGDYLRLSVADTGIGMDEATLARSIEPFFSTKGIGKGTGLGLSMVHGLAAQLGGGFAISSRPGLGTCVDLWLPLSDEAAGDPEESGPKLMAGGGKGTALLVDDEELVRMSTADMLAEFGYQVVEAASAAEALSQLDAGLDFDLLVTDHMMPGMSGADLAREVRDRLPGKPVLIVSGYAETEGIAPDLPRLTKPFRQADLAACLSSLAAGDAGAA